MRACDIMDARWNDEFMKIGIDYRFKSVFTLEINGVEKYNLKLTLKCTFIKNNERSTAIYPYRSEFIVTEDIIPHCYESMLADLISGGMARFYESAVTSRRAMIKSSRLPDMPLTPGECLEKGEG